MKWEFGVEVLSVDPRSPAGLNGNRVGDIIISVNGQEVAGADHIHRFLADWPIGKQVKLTVIRDQERLEIEVKPIEQVSMW